MVRKIVERVPSEQLEKDLEKYRRQALELGVTDAKIIPSESVIIDERVRAKCMFPRCSRYGTNAHCPPHAMDVEQTKKLIKKYRFGIFTRLEVPPEFMAGAEAKEKKPYLPANKKTYEIISRIEAEAFYDGYYLAVAFGPGSCKGIFCEDVECQALSAGMPCRVPLKARASMEGMGMDVYAMATKAGWDIYPIGAATSPCEVPFGAAYGLVLIY